MAIHYLYETTTGGQQARKLLIPESPEEELRGDVFTQENIDWLHDSEKTHIGAAVKREAEAEARRAESAGEDPQPVELVKVWTERAQA